VRSDIYLCHRQSTHHSRWLQALGARRRLLAPAARSTWMSATVSLAPPYGSLPYGKVLDSLVAKDGLASGPTISNCFATSQACMLRLCWFWSTCMHGANMQEGCTGDDGLSNVTLAGVMKSGLAGNGICEVGELHSGANSGGSHQQEQPAMVTQARFSAFFWAVHEHIMVL
jgi:hypothetical protein